MSSYGGYNPTEKELEKTLSEVKDIFRKYDYPITPELIKKLKEEYRANADAKGDSWRKECSYKFLIDKLNEEHNEASICLELMYYSKIPRVKEINHKRALAELLDLILVASMVHERLQGIDIKQEVTT